jgi:hypothetical protein
MGIYGYKEVDGLISHNNLSTCCCCVLSACFHIGVSSDDVCSLVLYDTDTALRYDMAWSKSTKSQPVVTATCCCVFTGSVRLFTIVCSTEKSIACTNTIRISPRTVCILINNAQSSNSTDQSNPHTRPMCLNTTECRVPEASVAINHTHIFMRDQIRISGSFGRTEPNVLC